MLVDRYNAIFAGYVPWNGGDNIVGDAKIVEIDYLSAEMSGLRLSNIRRPNQFVGQHQIDHADTGGLSFGLQLGHFVGRDKAEVHQDVYEIIVFFSHNREGFYKSVLRS